MDRERKREREGERDRIRPAPRRARAIWGEPHTRFERAIFTAGIALSGAHGCSALARARRLDHVPPSPTSNSKASFPKPENKILGPRI